VYQGIAFEVINGFSLEIAAAKLLLLIATLFWILSLLLIGLGRQSGVRVFAALPLPLALVVYLDGAETAYPFLDRPLSTFLLCAASAMWGAIVCYATAGSDDLFDQGEPEPD
jgi:hypothetical protein